MKWFKRAIAGLVAALVAWVAVVTAEPVERTFQLTWQNATLKVDGSPFDPATELAATICNVREAGNTVWIAGNTANGDATAMAVTLTLEPGNYEWACKHRDTDGQESDYTGFVLATVEPDPIWPPRAPTGLSVTVDNP